MSGQGEVLCQVVLTLWLGAGCAEKFFAHQLMAFYPFAPGNPTQFEEIFVDLDTG